MNSDEQVQGSVSRLYCPPDGALQFRITDRKNMFCKEILWVFPYRGVWRKQVLPGCPCSSAFQIVLESASSEVRRAAQGNNIIVCKCMGEILE